MHASLQAPLPLEIREFMESASQESSAHANRESPVPETPQATKEKDQTNEEVETEKKEGAEEGEQVSELLPERLTLGHGEEASQSPKQEPSSRSPKQSPKQESASSPVKAEVPPLVCISSPPIQKKQPLSLARAAGER